MRFLTVTIMAFWASLLLEDYVLAQPGNQWMRAYRAGNFRSGRFYDIFAKHDGGFVAVGAASNGNESSIGWLITIDEDGNPRLNRTYSLDGGNEYNDFTTVIQCDDGSYLAGGSKRFGGAPRIKFLLMRIEENGNRRWYRCYESWIGACHAVIELKGGSFLAAGIANLGQADQGSYLLMVDSEGETIWSHCYGEFFIKSMRETADGIICCGYNGDSGIIFKTDFNGELSWMRNAGEGELHAIARCGNDTWAAVGSIRLPNNRSRLWVVKITADGEIQANFNPQVDDDWAKFDALTMLQDGRLILAGASQFANSHGLVMRIAPDNGVMWYRIDEVVPDNHDISGYESVVVTQDNEFVLAGNSVDNYGLIVKSRPNPRENVRIIFSPEDSVIKTLPCDSIYFAAAVRGGDERVAEFTWFLDRQVISRAPEVVIAMDSLGEHQVDCRVITDNGPGGRSWRVKILDIFISAFTPDTLNLAIRRGASVDFSLVSVRYTDGDEPEYLWTKSNLDNQEQEVAGLEIRATVSFLQSGNYAVEGLAYRGESHDAVTWNVAVRGAIWSFAPEDVSLEVLPDSLIRFEVVPSEPENEALAIQWLVDGEVVGEDTTALELRFGRADSCPPYRAQVQVVVADTVEADTVEWEVVVRDLGIDNPTADPPRLAALLSVSPNPFNSMLTIRCSFAAINSGKQGLAIYDLYGREVARLWRDEGWGMRDEDAADRDGSAEGTRELERLSTRSLSWNASSIPAGVYFVRLQSGLEVSTKKVVLIR